MGLDPLSITAEVAVANFLVDVGLGIEAAYTAASVVAVTAPYALAAAAVGGSIALQAALAPDMKGTKAAKQSVALENGSRVYVIGRALVPARLIWQRSKSRFDLYSVGDLALGPLDGIEEFRISGRRVACDSGGTVKTEPFNGNVDIAVRLGTASQTVFSATNGAFPGHWLATARGDGEALLEWVSTSPGYDDPDHSEIYSLGFPTCAVVARGRAPFDPRLGSDPSNDAYRAWTDNSAVQIIDALTRSRDLAGWGKAASRFDLDDICDVAIPWCDGLETLRGGGTERRSRLGGIQDCGSGVKLGDVLRNMLMSSGLDLVRTRRGKVTLRPVIDAPDPTAIVPWRSVIAAPELDGGPVTFDRPNRFVLRYTEPARDYETVEADLTGIDWAVVQDEIDRTGVRPSTIELEYCPSVGQASRIGRRIAAMRRARKASYVFNLGGLRCAGHGEVVIDDRDIGEAVPLMISSVTSDFAARTVSVDGIVKPTLAAYAPEIDEAAAPEDRTEVPDATAPNEPAIVDAIIVATGWPGTRTWALRVKFTYSSGDSRDQQMIYAGSTDDGLTWEAWKPASRLALFGSSPAIIQTASEAAMSKVRFALSSANSSHNISAWVDSTVDYADPTAPLPAPTLIRTDNGDGTSILALTGSFLTAYYVITRVATIGGAFSTYSQGDCASDGSYSVPSAPTGYTYTIVAYDSAGRASPSVSVTF